jgi:hypothetical protein
MLGLPAGAAVPVSESVDEGPRSPRLTVAEPVSAPEAWRSMLGAPVVCWAATSEAEDEGAAVQSMLEDAVRLQAADGLRMDPNADSEDDAVNDTEAEVPPSEPLRGVALSWA